jgi:hypothetical protein
MKFLKWISDNMLSVFTIFLLAFIPLYPKIPLLDIPNTWVYVRAEDFAISLVIIVWIILFLFKKVTLKTPLTMPIMIFWLIGGLTTLHGVLLFFPTLANVFPNVAFLSYLRRIEYIFLFFIAFNSVKSKKSVIYVSVALAVTLFLVTVYGFGQKYLGFPAYLTMNEEFAKGIPIQLSSLSRVPSTFAGHYDLAAYLVLIIPILVSLAFGFKNIISKILLLIVSGLGLVLLFMTVSRVSVFVLLFSLFMLLVFQKKKIVLILLLVLTFALLIFSPSLLQRFNSTVSEVNVLVDSTTGGAVGQVREVPATYFDNKVVRKILMSKDAVVATGSAVMSNDLIPSVAYLVVEANSSTGESLPQGTSYVNLSLSPVVGKINEYYFQKSIDKNGIKLEEINVFYGDYLIKKAKAYDLSFTTRFQGEWPKTFEAFKRNIFLGSGYGSVSLAVDNNYLRILGESGLLGLFAFISIFIVAFIYIKRLLPKVDSALVRSLTIGFAAGSLGLGLNAFLIDVFEASKIAFTYWLLMGTVIGILFLYQKEEIDLFKEFKKALVSPYAVIVYIFFTVAALFYPIISNYFVGDDFTWFRWAQDCCGNVINYFTQANGFFYRPGTKLYFSFMYSAFWLNQTMYHLVSILLHFATSAVLFLVLRKILKNYSLAIISTLLFVVLSGHHEDIFWISSTGFLFNALFSLIALLSFIYYKEKKKIIYLIISSVCVILSLLFHELGVVAPLLIILYDVIFNEKIIFSKILKKISYLIILFPLLPYLGIRFFAQSHWFNGDYSYNIMKLPYNVLGNTIGYMIFDLLGPQSLSFYEGSRNFLKNHILIAMFITILTILILIVLIKKVFKKVEENERKIIYFGFWFFLIALLPFLGLGNLSSRYSYLSSVGFVVLFSFLIKKIYMYLEKVSNSRIAVICIIIVTIIYSMIQLFELQKIHIDWKFAGEKSQNFLISVERYSKDFWLKQKMQFYFVNMPIRNGEAWVWPVGLKDAIWFTFKNPNIVVNTSSDIVSVFNQAAGSSDAHVFRFNYDGSVDEVVRAKNGQINLLNPPR